MTACMNGRLSINNNTLSCSCTIVAQDTWPFVVTSCLFMFMMFLSVTASCFALLSPSPCWCCSINPHYNPNLRRRKKLTAVSGVSSARCSSSITADLSELLALFIFYLSVTWSGDILQRLSPAALMEADEWRCWERERRALTLQKHSDVTVRRFLKGQEHQNKLTGRVQKPN